MPKLKDDITFEQVDRILFYDPLSGVFTRKITINKCIKGSRAGSLKPDGYRSISIYGKHYLEHRLAWLLYYKKWPFGELDHKNTIRSDNAIDNLREATTSQNGMNKNIQSNNKSGHVGVFWIKRDERWCASIKFEGENIRLGYFKTKEEAVICRKKAEEKYFGDFRKNAA